MVLAPRLRRDVVSVVAGLVMLALIATTLGSCGGSGSGSSAAGSDPATTDPAVVDPLAPTRFSDPSQPVPVALGGRFDLVVPADPTRGWRWVLEPVDTAVVVPLASEFLDDPELLVSTSSTTTSTSSTLEPAVTWIPTTTTTIDPDSPEAAPLVQVISFAGRSAATTEIHLRYERIGGSGAAPRRTTFTVVVRPPSS